MGSTGIVRDAPLPLFELDGEPETDLELLRWPHRGRIVADAADRVTWLAERARGVTATDVARLASARSLEPLSREKRFGSRFTGNAFTEHGVAREPAIARWVLAEHGIAASTHLYHAAASRRHLATPDGVAERAHGALELAEIKTTARVWRSIPRHYLRQVWWQQHVLGADRTLVVWERHVDFRPVGDPQSRWVDRDDREIDALVRLADQLLALVASRRRTS